MAKTAKQYAHRRETKLVGGLLLKLQIKMRIIDELLRVLIQLKANGQMRKQ